MATNTNVVYSLHLENNHTLSAAFRAAWATIKEDLTLNDDSYEYLLDWVTREIWGKLLAERGIAVIGHHRSDEGKCIVENHMAAFLLSTSKRLQRLPFTSWPEGSFVKIMVLDNTVVIGHSLNKRDLA